MEASGSVLPSRRRIKNECSDSTGLFIRKLIVIKRLVLPSSVNDERPFRLPGMLVQSPQFLKNKEERY